MKFNNYKLYFQKKKIKNEMIPKRKNNNSKFWGSIRNSTVTKVHVH